MIKDEQSSLVYKQSNDMGSSNLNLYLTQTLYVNHEFSILNYSWLFVVVYRHRFSNKL